MSGGEAGEAGDGGRPDPPTATATGSGAGPPSDAPGPRPTARGGAGEAAGTCDRCGGRLGRGSVRVSVAPVADDAADPPLDACRECARSFSRWVERGRSRHRAARKPKAPRAEKKPSRRGKSRPDRQQVALGVVIALGLMFFYYLYTSFL